MMEQMTNILNHYLMAHDFDCEADLGTDFAYFDNHNLITYAVVIPERMDKLFMDFAHRHGLSVECGNFIMSFFHELGHFETFDDFDEDELMDCAEIKNHLTTSDEDCETYFSMEDEFAATMWAIEYINSHLDEVKALSFELSKAFADFCKKIDLVD